MKVENAITFWKEQFTGKELSPTTLPFSKTASRTAPRVRSLEASLSPDISRQIIRLNQGSPLGMFVPLLAGVQCLLHKYTNDTRIVLGMPAVNKRDSSSYSATSHTLIIQQELTEASTFKELCEESGAYVAKAIECGNVPFEIMTEGLELQHIEGAPVVNILVSMEGIHHVHEYNREVISDISFIFGRADDLVRLNLVYNEEVYDSSLMTQLINHLNSLFSTVIFQPETPLGRVGIVTGDEQRLLLTVFNDHDREFPKNTTFHQIFEKQAEATPEAIAVIYKNDRLTYRELNERSNRLAGTLRAQGVRPGQLVGIMVDRCAQMITAVMAVWKAGGAYVPLDPDYPSDRLQYLLTDSETSVLLTQAHYAAKVNKWLNPEARPAILCIEDESSYSASSSNIPNVNHPKDLAYIIYTSGTTGRPKGVMIEHSSLINTAAAYRREYGLSEQPVRLLQLASFSFDVFVGDIARTLFNGGTMIICPKEDRIDPNRLYGWIHDYQVTLFESTPALIVPFMEHIADLGLDIGSLRLLITSSDSCSVKDYKVLQERFGSQIKIINAYGVTEAAIDSSFYDEPLDQLPPAGNVPIGKPWLNARFYIVDSHMNPVPVGVPGELCIGGAGVARGYWNQPELSREKFVDDPFVPGERMYRTGDLARWMWDGNVDFIGRIDYQTKIRGYRIEIGEIETWLRKAPGIREAVVIVHEDEKEEKVLCAYFVSDIPQNDKDLRMFLSRKMPDFMVPAYFIPLDKLPVTVNGKIDRKALVQRKPFLQEGVGLTGGNGETAVPYRVTGYSDLRSESVSYQAGEKVYLADIAAANNGVQEMLQSLSRGAALVIPKDWGKELQAQPQGRIGIGNRPAVHFGIPVNGKHVYILNKNKQLQPVGIFGELYIAGEELSGDHLGRCAAVAERLDDDPFTEGGKMIRTGLRAKYLEDGSVHCEEEQGHLRLVDMPDFNQQTADLGIAMNETEELLLQIWKDVLGRTEIRLTDDFFAIGGHSLKMMTLLSRMKKKLQADIPLQAITEHSTIRSLSEYIRKAKAASYQAITRVQEQPYYPVSSVQRRMYFIQQFEGVGTSYHIPSVLELKGPLEVNRLTEALKALVQRHEALRTSFHLVDEALVQRIHPQADFEVVWITSGISELQAVLRSFMRPFELDQAPLVRAAIVKVEEERHFLLLDMNHIIFDGLSGDIFLDELMKLYRGVELPELSIQYKDFCAWQNAALQQGAMAKQEAYWLDQLRGELPTLELPADYPRPSVKDYTGQVYTFTLDEKICARLKDFMTEHNVSSFVLLLSVYLVLLYKCTGDEDIIVGTNTSGRSHPDLEQVVGMFANTVALRNFPSGNRSFLEFMLEVKRSVFGAMEHADYPLEELIEKLRVKRDVSRNPLFDTMFVMENTTTSQERFAGIEHKAHNMEWNYSKMDITWYVQELEEGNLQILVEYCEKLFSEPSIQRMSRHFSTILTSILNQPHVLLENVEFVSEIDAMPVLVDFNRSENLYEPFRPLHVILEEQADRRPDEIALAFEDRTMTYEQFNGRVNQLARHLRSRGIGRNDIVGVLFDRSFEMMIGILGILKAGGAYMPISPGFPKDRVDFMIRNSGANLLLVQRCHLAFAEGFGIDSICCDDEAVYTADDSNVPNVNEENDLAYVLYTSGSTGQPKGVMIEHYTIYNRISWMVKEYNIHADDVLLQKTPYVFDVSVWELFMWFFIGARLCLLGPGEEKSPDKMIECMERWQVTGIHFVPSMFNSFLDFMENPEYLHRLNSLRRIFTSGEALLPNHVSRFQSLKHHARIYNLYGPTEATVDITYYNCPVDEELRMVPIGRPIDNVQIYIVSPSMQLQPIGIPGELCVSGVCLARGYINRDDLTGEKFVPNPFKTGERMYRTGDLARWLPDGNIEYLGRIDNQVKVRGYRIELDEITSKLVEISSIKDGAVIARKDSSGAPYLCAYIVSDDMIDTDMIRKSLQEYLPDYMVPAHFVQMDRMPLNHNGKLDRKALPEPSLSVETEYIAPEQEREILLADIWRKVLKLDKVGITDNFFELGGDSIKAIHVVAHLNKHGLKIDMTDFFKYPNIRDVIPFIQEKTLKLNQELVTGEGPLTSVQKWFFETELQDRNHWNQAVLLHSVKGWDSGLLKQALDRLAEHHDALRTVMIPEKTGFRQSVRGLSGKVYTLETVRADERSDVPSVIEQTGDRLHRSLDLQEGPLIRIGHILSPEGEYLLFAIHHLLIDGVSWGILLEDFSALYQQLQNKEAVSLPEKTSSYLDWSKEVAIYADSDSILGQLPYWREVDQTRIASLPVDMPHNSAPSRMSEVVLKVDHEVKNLLLTSVHKAYHTEINDILLAALSLTIQNWTKADTIAISLEGHGREEIIKAIDISRTIGWFTTIYPVIFKLEEDPLLPAVIKEVKETLRSVPQKGIGYGMLKYLTSAERLNGHTFHLQPQILFNYLGRIDEYDNNDHFTMSNLSTGKVSSDPVRSRYLLDINGMIIQDELTFIFSFDSSRYAQSTIDHLAQAFHDNLKQFVQHCSELKESERTPSDFSAQELSVEELEEIFDAL